MLSFFDRCQRLERVRQKALTKGTVPQGAAALYQKPLPSSAAALSELEFAAIDFETTGLNFAEDFVLSMGGVLLNKGQIDFATGFHFYLDCSLEIKKDSAVINQITPEALISGKSRAEAFELLLQHIAGRILICHGAVIERSFLLKLLGLPPSFELPVIFLDTLLLERSLKSHSGRTEDLRLSAIRQQRGFPAYACHNALADSVAAAEVFIAQVKEIFGKRQTPTLGPLLKRCC